MAEAARTALARDELVDQIRTLRLHDRHEHELGQARAGLDDESRLPRFHTDTIKGPW
jgi:hypothetical protein